MRVLQYTSITPTSFINCTRGALSTTAAVYVGGTAVYSNDVNNDTLVYTNNNTALNWKKICGNSANAGDKFI